MFNYKFTDSNTLELIDEELAPLSCKEPRPVYAGELNLLGFDKLFNYPHDCKEPLMWGEFNDYYYNGLRVAKLSGGDVSHAPAVRLTFPITEVLKPVPLSAMATANRELMRQLEERTLRRIRDAYNDYKDRIDMFIVSFSGGKDSMVLLDLVQRALPHDAFRVFYTDTGMEYPDSAGYVQTVKDWCASLGIEFVICHSDQLPEQTWHEFGPPASNIRWCCSVHKTAPQVLKAREIAGRADIRKMSFIGVRASESLTRSSYEFIMTGAKHTGETSLNAILDWNSAEVYLYIYERRLPLNPAYMKGNRRVGCLVCPGATPRCEYVTRQCYPEAYDRLFGYVKEMYDPVVTTNHDIDDISLHKIWVARKNGNGLLLPCNCEEDYDGDTWTLKMRRLRPDWKEWVKTIGVLLNDASPYQVKFKGKTYQFTLEQKNGLWYMRVTTNHTGGYRSFCAMIKRVFHKASCCVACRVCEADCPYGCLSMADGTVHVSDKCRHCSECHKVHQSCHVYNSLYKRRNGKEYWKKNEKDVL